MPSRPRRKQWLHLPHDHGEPLSRPRYDVVAGVLFAVAGMLLWASYKNPTHAIVVDLPSPFPYSLDRLPEETVVRIGLSADGRALVDGLEVDHHGLRTALRNGLMQPVEPLVVFDPHPDAAYGQAANLLAIIKGSGVTKFCFARQVTRELFGNGSENRLYLFSSIPAEPARQNTLQYIEPSTCPEDLIRTEHAL